MRGRSTSCSLIVVAIAALVGCRDRGRPRDSAAAKAPPPSVAAVPIGGICLDDENEQRALACSGGAVRRNGDTLFLRTVSGDSSYVSTGDAGVIYRYVGRLLPALHVLYAQGDAGWYEIIDGHTGQRETIVSLPVLSPDAKRFADMSNALDVCEGDTRIDIWSVSEDSFPTKEWTWRSDACLGDNGWGPGDFKWRSPDTLEVTRLDNAPDSLKRRPGFKYHERQILLVKVDTGWAFIQ